MPTTDSSQTISVLESDEKILERFKAYRVPGSHLDRMVQEMLEKTGIKHGIEIFVSRSAAVNAAMQPGADGLRIIITEPMLHGLDSSAYGAVSPELKGIIGHEIGHMAEGGMRPYILGGFLPILALPMIAVMARHYLARAHEKQLHPEAAKEYIYHEADKEYQPLPYEKDAPHTPQEKKIVTFAKDLAVGLLGLGIGSFVAKLNANRIEYACDKWGAKFSSPEAMKSGFIKMEKAFSERKLAGIKVPDADPFKYGDAQSKVHKWFIRFVEETITSHPTTKNRIERLERMSQSMAAGQPVIAMR